MTEGEDKDERNKERQKLGRKIRLPLSMGQRKICRGKQAMERLVSGVDNWGRDERCGGTGCRARTRTGSKS